MSRTPKATKPEAVQTTLAVQRDLRHVSEGPHLLPWMKAFAVWMATHAGLHHPTQAEQLAFIEDRTGARLSPRLLRKMRVRPAFIEYYHAACYNVEGQAMEEFKNHLPEYKVIEERFMKAISTKFMIEVPLPEEVHDADMQMYHYEVDELSRNPNTKCKTWTPEEARANFLSRYYELKGHLDD